MADINSLHHWLSSKDQQHESRCRHCGACCGALEDPCEHLVMSPEGLSSCRVYISRLGPQRTIAGRPFNCVPLREKIGTSWPGDDRCPYKRTFP